MDFLLRNSPWLKLAKFETIWIILVFLFSFRKQLLEQTGTSPSQMASAHSTDSYVYAKYDFFYIFTIVN